MDRFKEINDTFGHAAGDRTLEILTERLTRIVPKEAVVGRLAGDEFALFIEELHPQGEEERAQAVNLARTRAHRSRQALLRAAAGTDPHGQHRHRVLPADAENVIDLIRNADAAMYHAKQNGGNSFAFYTPEMNAAAVERLMLKSKLRRALERDELMCLPAEGGPAHGRIVGAEALLRWRLPGHGDIPPSQFIPLAEETNLILEIGEWVLGRVCLRLPRGRPRWPTPAASSLNLSLKQLRQASFITRAARCSSATTCRRRASSSRSPRRR
jgi:diguanylate cyclase (GGDEF)-like protein